jgi:hypothetical protein
MMTIKYSGKCFLKVSLKTRQHIWPQLHEGPGVPSAAAAAAAG